MYIVLTICGECSTGKMRKFMNFFSWKKRLQKYEYTSVKGCISLPTTKLVSAFCPLSM